MVWGRGVVALSAQDGGGIADRFTNLSFTVGDALLAVLILLLGWLVSRSARRAVLRASAQLAGVSDDLRFLGARIAGYLVLLMGVGLALAVLGVQLQPLLAVVLLIGVVLVLALRGIADNFAAGIVIQTRRPIHLGDWIEGLDHQGVVRELNSRSVVIETPDGRVVHLPNHQLLNNPIINHTAAGRRRTELEVRVAAVATRTSEIIELVLEAAASATGVRTDPAPSVTLLALEPERTTLTVQIWHDPADAASVASAAVQAIAERIRTAGVRGVVLASPAPSPLTPPPPM